MRFGFGRSSTPTTSHSQPANDTLAPPIAPSRPPSWRSLTPSKSKGTPKAAATPNPSAIDVNVLEVSPKAQNHQDSQSPTLGSPRHSIASLPSAEEETGAPPFPQLTLAEPSKSKEPFFRFVYPDAHGEDGSEGDMPTGTYQEHVDENKRDIWGFKGSYSRRNTGAFSLHYRHDYKNKYPEDRYGQEMGPIARIWKTSIDETEKHDREMTIGWRDSIDALLVFAGLFSAVISAFLSQTYMALQPDIARITAILLLEQIALTRAMDAGIPLSTVPITTTSEDLDFAAHVSSWTDYVTHGLWFTSLTLSLITALFAVVMKQWISSYMAPISGNPREQTRMRHFRFKGLEKWHVPGLFGFLPVLLHISLFLFLAGLVSFLTALDLGMALFTAVLTGAAFLAYITANTLPVFFPECPYRTPISGSINYLWWLLTTSIRRIRHRATLWWQKASQNVRDVIAYASLSAKEAVVVHDLRHYLDMDVAVWTYENTSNSTVRDIALEALAGLNPDFTLRSSDVLEPIALKVEAAFNQCFTADQPPTIIPGTNPADVERLGRALIQLDRKTASPETKEQFRGLLYLGRSPSCHPLNNHLRVLGQAFIKVLTDDQRRQMYNRAPGEVDPIFIHRIITPDNSLHRSSVLRAALSSGALPDPVLLRLLCVIILDSHRVSLKSAAAEPIDVKLIDIVLTRAKPIWTMGHQSPAYGSTTGMSMAITHLAVQYVFDRLFYDPWTFSQQASFASLTMEETVQCYLRSEQNYISRTRILQISSSLLKNAVLPRSSNTLRDAIVASLIHIFESSAVKYAGPLVATMWNSKELSLFEQVAAAAERLTDTADQAAMDAAGSSISVNGTPDHQYISGSSYNDCERIRSAVRALTFLCSIYADQATHNIRGGGAELREDAQRSISWPRRGLLSLGVSIQTSKRWLTSTSRPVRGPGSLRSNGSESKEPV